MMETKEKLVPELRFPEYIDDWSQESFRNLTKINQGLQISISERLTEEEEGSYFYITNEFLRANSEKQYYIKNPSKSVICSEDDILMTRTGNTGMVVTNVSGAFHNNFFKIAYSNKLVKDFLYYYLILTKTQNIILRLAGTSTIPDLNHSDFYRIKIQYPIVEEQQKIASFLSAVDEKINQLQRKKELLQAYKKGMMQQLFSQQLRFKSEDGNDFPEWEEKKLGKVGEIVNGLTYSPNDIDDNGVIVLRSSNVKKRRIDLEDQVRVSVEKYNPVKTGDILICVRNGSKRLIGKNALIRSKDENLAFGAFMSVFRSGYNEFIFHLFGSDIYKKQVYQNLGATINSINGSDLKKFKIPFPSIEEQTKIASFLSALDAKIDTVSTAITQTQDFKKALLQQMFV